MAAYITLANSTGSLSKKFVVTRRGYRPTRSRAGRVMYTVTGKADYQASPIVKSWTYQVKAPIVPETGYGSYNDIATFYFYNDPAGSPSNVITFIDFDGTS